MKVCTVCRARWRGEPAVCPLDGGALEDIPDPLLGRVLGGRFHVLERIGAGGMGTVYRAAHGADIVAVKVLSPELSSEATHRERFLREAKAANRIDDPHVIEVLDAGQTEDGLVYLAMEHLVGEPLSRVIARGPVPPHRAVHIAWQIASTLVRAHELDVIHRDIKPDNVFLLEHDGADFVKLLDFGLARIKGEMRLTANGAVFGTPEYMAPEQARGGALSGSADLYALGCVLYEMVTGRPPFNGPVADLVMRHVREVPAPPSARVASLSPELDAVVLALLEKNPARRPDAERAAALLRAYVDGAPAAIVDDDWSARAARLTELARRRHPDGAPPWIEAALAELASVTAALRRVRAELELVRAASSEGDSAATGAERLGAAIDVLRRDETRASADERAAAASVEEAEARRASIQLHLVRAWEAVSLSDPPSPEQVEALHGAGQLAGAWLAAARAVESRRRDLAERTGVRRGLELQRHELEARLSAHHAREEAERAAREERARQLSASVDAALERVAALAAPLAQYLEPSVRDEVAG